MVSAVCRCHNLSCRCPYRLHSVSTAHSVSSSSGCHHCHSLLTLPALLRPSSSQLRVWGADDLKLVNILRGHRGSVLCLLALGHLLISGARDNTIR